MLVMVYLLTGDVSFVDMDQRNRLNGPIKPCNIALTSARAAGICHLEAEAPTLSVPASRPAG